MNAEWQDEATDVTNRPTPLEARLTEAEDQCRLERAKRIELAALIGQFIERAVPLINDAGLFLDPRELERPLAKPSPVGLQGSGGWDVSQTRRDGMLELEVSLTACGRRTPIAVLTCLDSLTGKNAALVCCETVAASLTEGQPAELYRGIEVSP